MTTATYLKYANVQMAAEAIYTDVTASPGQKFAGAIDVGTLFAGNGRASKFTVTQADEFSKDWAVVEHISNTTTGFSGTLFRALRTDSIRGIRQGELVLSFRSTEFADDAVRDNRATNYMEIKDKGWAFGQIDDMERWYASLRASGKIPSDQGLTVTGYSLGGHLATAFNLLHPGETAAAYTFNGAGVGIVKSGTSLNQVIDEFRARRTQGNADLFTDQIAAALYQEYRGFLTVGSAITSAQVATGLTTLTEALQVAVSQPTSTLYAELFLLHQAMSRIGEITSEIDRISVGIPSGTQAPPAQQISPVVVEALGLDYQLAVIKASVNTYATRTVYDQNGIVAYVGRAIAPNPVPGLLDVFGEIPPSGVANSQIHYGSATPIWIEDQPLMRGEAVSEFWKASGVGVLALDFKLLVPGFALNDFGDTHSLVLLVDSLAVQNAFALLAPSLTAADLKPILIAASNARAETGYASTVGPNNQGKADGDTLENLVSALGAYLGVDSAADWVALKGNPSGGTWNEVANKDGFTGRSALHKNLSFIASDPDYANLIGKVTIEAISPALSQAGKDDFGSLVALHTLSPFVLKAAPGTDGEAKLNELWTGYWAEELAAWQSDRAARTAGQPAVNYTDSWIADRASMLGGLTQRNRLNAQVATGGTNTDYVDAASGTTLAQRTAGAGTNAPANKVWFGSDSSESIVGSDNAVGDHLYGGAGVDTLLGGVGNDILEGGADADSLVGGLNNDFLSGGTGSDAYIFDTAFGKDTITDSDGQGSIQIETKALGKFKGAGRRGGYAFDMGGGQYAGLALIDSPTSSTGYRAVIVKGTDTANTITIDNFDLARALGNGYLGITLDSLPQVALVQGGAANYWADIDASAASLANKSSILQTGKRFLVSLSLAPSAGETLLLSLVGLAGKGLKIILGDETIDADGAVIPLAEGQTEVSLALVQEGTLDADASGSLTVTYQGEAGSASSNPWGLSLEATSETGATINGDTVVQTETNGNLPITRFDVNGTPVDVVAAKQLFFVTDAQNNLVTGTSEPTLIPIYNDAHEIVGYTEVPSDDIAVTDNTLYGTAGNDAIDGKTGSDLIAGNAGNDQIDGGVGNDMIGGGAGDDRILGGDGNDFISSSADIQPDHQQLGPNDRWDLWGAPQGAEVQAAGTMWGVYPDSGDTTTAVWSGMAETRTEAQSDTVDAGAGDDWVMASWGDDRIEGGDGNDRLEGLAGDDILEGGDGNDKLDGDGILKPGYMNSVASDHHGSDFIDGGLGDDSITGGGGSDNIFGGAGRDTLFADGSGASDSLTFVDLDFQGEDYVDGEDGDDYAEGGGRDDVLYGGSGQDILWGDAPAANLKGAAATDSTAWGNDTLDGEDGDDLLYGGGGDDTLYGGKGIDQLVGDDGPDLAASMHGSDYLDGEDGNDSLIGGGKDDILYGGAGNDTLQGDSASIGGQLHGADELDGEDGNDFLIGQGGADRLYGGAGDDVLQGDGGSVAAQYQGADFLDGGEGDDRLSGGGGDDVLIGGLGADQLSGDEGDDSLAGGAGVDVLVGGVGNDSLDGGDGNDSLYAGSGNDQLMGGAGDDDLNSGDGDDLVNGGTGDDRYAILGTQGTKILVDEGGTETVDLGWRLADTELGRGSLLLRNTATGQQVHIEGFDAGDAASVSPIEQFMFLTDDGALVDLSAAQLIEQLGFTAHGTGDNDVLTGTPFYDNLVGGAGDDVLAGRDGDDRLVGGPGADQLLGGRGDDVYVVDVQGEDEIIEAEGEGQDTIEASVDYSLVADSVEAVRLTGTQALNATGNDGANHLIGNAAANILDGGAGADVLEGRGGNDTYLVDSGDDLVVEQEGAGRDTVISSASYVLPIHVDNLVLTGEAQSATGNNIDNRLAGNDADNTLRGMMGNDRLEGGAGNDLYVVLDDIGVKTIADEGGDHDVVDLGWNFYATHFVLGSAADRVGLYNAVTHHLVEIEGFDPLAEDPESSIETMHLTFRFQGVDGLAIVPIEERFAEQGLSFFGTDGADTLTGTWRRDTMYGFDGNDTLFGTGGDDVFEGGAGLDWMAGGVGDDLYIVADSGDVVVEAAGEGIDFVFAESDYSIQGTEVEELFMTGADHHVGIGNDLANHMYSTESGSSTLFGEGGNDRLFGHIGNDSLHGGAQNDEIFSGKGDDLLAGDEGEDVLAGEEGNDTLIGGDGNDQLLGDVGDDRLEGSAGDDVLWGNSGDDVLEGGAGDDVLQGQDGRDQLFGGDGRDLLFNSRGGDTLAGGSGDDTYREDSVHALILGFAESGTVIVEAADAGTDTVIAYESFTLGDNVENLLLQHLPYGDPLVGIGNELANRLEEQVDGPGARLFGLGGDDVLLGGGGANWLDGGAGEDLMIGRGSGRTDFVVDDANDCVVPSAAGAIETVHSSIDYLLGEALDDLVLDEGSAIAGTGNEFANRITGNSNDNILDGGAGRDELWGRGGNDLLLGNDAGTSMFGEAGDDQLFGGAAEDLLDGGSGADRMIGGTGDDTYRVDDLQDVVVEAEGAGIDTVLAAIDYTLLADFENLTMYGYGLTGVGNAQGNVIVGHDGGMTLVGLDGDDTLDAGTGFGSSLDGGAGSDTLVSGAGWSVLAGGDGDDLYDLSGSFDSLVEQAGGGDDHVVLGASQDRWVYLELADNVESLDASRSDANLQIRAGIDDNVIVSGAGNDTIDGGPGDDMVFGGEARSVTLTGQWSQDVADDISEFLRYGPTVPKTLSRLLTDFQYSVSLDSASLADGYHAYAAVQLPSAPEQAPQHMTLYLAPWMQYETEGSQVILIDPDGTLTWEGGGSFQEELDRWTPRSRMTWEELETQYGVQAMVAREELDGYVVLTASGVPAPGQAVDGDAGWNTLTTLYWPRDRLPTEIQALLDENPELTYGENAVEEAFSRSGVDTISGGDGNDTLDGGDGNDVLLGGEGVDVLIGGADKTLSLRVEHPLEGFPITLTIGTILSSNDDVLDGGAGLDLLAGGSGDDTYYVDGESTPNPDGRVAMLDWCDVDHRFGMDGASLDSWVTDTVVEAQDEGNDRVIASASVVVANVETVELSESAPNLDIDAETGAGSQTLLGNSGRNMLDGGAGADLMAAGAGDDTYVVDDAADVVVEEADAGQDIVRTTLDHYVLGENLEALLLDGSEDLSAAGNAEANILIGNAGDNVLDGDAGDDILAGWRGNDVMRGGEGFDVYLFARGDGDDAVEDNLGGALHFSGDIWFDELDFRRDASDLVISVNATDDAGGVQVTVRDWMDGGPERLSEITFCADAGVAALDEFVLMRPRLDLVTVSADSSGATGNVLDNDGDPSFRDRLILDQAYEWGGLYGTFRVDLDGSFAYTLDSAAPDVLALAHGQVETDWYDYAAVDQLTGQWLGFADVLFDVVGVNDAPVTAPDEAFVSEDGDVTVTGNLLANDTDVDQGDALAIGNVVSQDGVFGSLTLSSSGEYAYSLANGSQAVQSLGQGEQAIETFGYSVVDSQGAESAGTIEIVVAGTNDAPTGEVDGTSCVEDGADAIGNVLANDSDIDANDTLSVTNPGLRTGDYGRLQLAADGGFTYSVDNASAAVQSLGAAQQVVDQFTYTLTDSHGATALADLNVEIVGVNDGPTAQSDVLSAFEDGVAVSGNVLANDSDPDAGDTLAVSNAGVVSGQYGQLALASDGSFRYAVDNAQAVVQALAAGQHVSETFAYDVSDSSGAQASAQLIVDIAGTNDGPLAHADSASVTEGDVAAATGNVLANDTDVDAGDTLRVSDAGSRTGQYGTLVLDTSGGYSYSLANSSPAVQALSAGQTVSDVFAYTVADNHGSTATAQLTVEITGAADSCGLTLVGSDRNDTLAGTDCADVIDGAKGSDSMSGGKGDDTYFVDASSQASGDDQGRDDDDDRDDDDRDDDKDKDDDKDDKDDKDDDHDDDDECRSEQGDRVIELPNAGVDTVAASVNYVLPQNVENLMLLGTAPRVASGNSQANVMVASAGASTLSGLGGNDVLVGRAAADTLDGGAGDDKLYGEGGNDKLKGEDGADRIGGGAGNDVIDGGRGDNVIAGGAGDDTITAGSGSDVVVAGAGDDRITVSAGNDFVDAGAGNDVIDGGSGSDFIAAGRGNDTLTPGAGRDVIAFNRGDGRDVLHAAAGSSASTGDVLSLGGGIRYADLTLRRTGQDLVLGLGATDQITSKDWYAGQVNKGISTLQVVTVGGDYNPASTDRLLGNQVVAFDFTTVTQQYDAARKANSSIGAWALQPALNSAFVGASNTSALGGDLAFDYATTYAATQGYGADMTAQAVRTEVKEQAGNNWQAASAAPVAAPGSTLVDPWVALQAGTDLVVSTAAGASNPITPTSNPATDSLLLAALAASSDIQQPSWAVR